MALKIAQQHNTWWYSNLWGSFSLPKKWWKYENILGYTCL